MLPLSSCSAAGLTLSSSFSGCTSVYSSFYCPIVLPSLVYVWTETVYIFKKHLLWTRKV